MSPVAQAVADAAGVDPAEGAVIVRNLAAVGLTVVPTAVVEVLAVIAAMDPDDEEAGHRALDAAMVKLDAAALHALSGGGFLRG